MAFMDMFRPQQQPQQQPQSQQSEVQSKMAQLRSMLSGDITPIMQQASASGATCTLPDGSNLTLQQLAQRFQGQSPADAFKACGYDFSEVMGILNS